MINEMMPSRDRWRNRERERERERGIIISWLMNLPFFVRIVTSLDDETKHHFEIIVVQFLFMLS